MNKAKGFYKTGLLVSVLFLAFCCMDIGTSESSTVEPFWIRYESGQTVYQAFSDTNGEYYLYLPETEKNTCKLLRFSSELKDVDDGVFIGENAIQIDENICEIHVKDLSDRDYTLHVVYSEIPGISIMLKGSLTLEEVYAQSKEEKYKGNRIILSSGDTRRIIENVEFKGRGNFTWGLEKRSFQFKLPIAEPVFGMTEAKTWILLSNHLDNSLIRNKLALDLAVDMGIHFAVDSRYVDLWINGEYLGNYLLTEKVQISPRRVALKNKLGVLVELDNLYYGDEEYYQASAISGTVFVLKDTVIKDPDGIAEKEAFTCFMEYMNSFEEALYSHADWNTVSSYMDVDSFIQMYFLQELSEDSDGLRSSFFLYRDGENDVIHLGPAWDYDVAFGNFTTDKRGGNPRIDYVEHLAQTMEVTSDLYGLLFQYQEFRNATKMYYKEHLRSLYEETDERIQRYAREISSSAEMNFKRWHTQGKEALFENGHKNKDTYEEEVDYLIDWLRVRERHIIYSVQ